MKTLAARLAYALDKGGKSPAELSRATGKSESAVSQWLSGETKSMRSDSLMATCALLSCSPQWLASGKGDDGFPRNSDVVEIGSIRNQKTTPDELVIPQFESGGSMGRGLLLRDQPGVIRGWTVNQEWIQKNVPSNSGSGNLCIVTGFGPSMRPLFNPGDPLLVDRGVTSYQGDAIYFFRVGDEGFIKSLQSIPGQGFRVISANRDHFDPWTITDGMDFEVFGRVLKVWKGEDF